jgi:hypothetical protein
MIVVIVIIVIVIIVIIIIIIIIFIRSHIDSWFYIYIQSFNHLIKPVSLLTLIFEPLAVRGRALFERHATFAAIAQQPDVIFEVNTLLEVSF